MNMNVNGPKFSHKSFRFNKSMSTFPYIHDNNTNSTHRMNWWVRPLKQKDTVRHHE